MTIFVKNVEWFQTQSEIFITLPIKANKFTTDIVIATKFLKLSARPYFYELFFEQPVCAEQSTCRILESNIKFRLKKSTDSQWIRLGYAPKADENQGGCGFTNDTKKQILIEHENSIKDDLASKQKEKANLKRIEVDKEIERGNVIRSKIHETELALKEYHCQNDKDSENAVCPTLVSTQDSNTKYQLPPIRSSGTINVELSLREFLTPKRESQEHAEREWCAKQHQIVVDRMEFTDKNLNLDECDVFWLLKKGLDFIEKKNYLAAVSAFSCGLKLSKDLPEIYLGRARVQYALKNYKRCAEDCSEALEKFKPAAQSNLLNRIHCFWLRGKSLLALGLTSHGEGELQMAAKLDPQNFEKNQLYFLSDEQ